MGGNLKKQLRDTQRLLSRANLPADVRRDKERMLSALQVQMDERQKQEQTRKMVSAYRMVRFFEEKKAVRHLKQALKGEEEAAKEKAIMDLNYVLHFPKDRKYISLFPSAETTDERVLEERRAIRDKINQELVAKAQVSSILEAPLPDVMTKAKSEDLPVVSHLAPGHRASDDDEDDDEDQEDESEEDGSEGEDDDGSDDDEGLDDEDDDDLSGSDDDDLSNSEDGSDMDSDGETGSDDESDFDSDDSDSDELDSEDDDSDEEDDFDSDEYESSDEDENDESEDDDAAPQAKRRK